MNRVSQIFARLGASVFAVILSVGSMTVIATSTSIQPAAASSSGVAATLDQCVNGPLTAISPCLVGTLASTNYKGWVNGNANKQKSHWREGDFIAYRTTMTGLPSNTITLSASFDTVVGGKHAIDYLGSYDATETTSTTGAPYNFNNSNPCYDQLGSAAGSGCTAPGTPPSPAASYTVPSEGSNLTACLNALTNNFTGSQLAGAFKIFAPSAASASISGVTLGAQQTSGSGACSETFSVTFSLTGTAPASGWTVVLAWGGHIASELDWGAGQAAQSISGSPYHMNLDSFTIGGTTTTIGAQSRQLDSNAIYFTPGLVTTIKDASGATVTSALPGTIVHDTAAFTGQFSTAIGGTVTYQRFATADCTGTVATTQNVSVGAGGAIPDASTFTIGSSSVSFNAIYNGDGTNVGVTSACEPLTVSQHTTGLSTATSPTSLVVGSGAINDTATLTGGYSPSGTIDFYLFSPSQTCTTTPGASDYTWHYQASVSGNGAYTSTPGYTPTVTGTWQWVAV
ncbi:MAG TPA: hypothetical protein VLS91_06295, partial [Acidimicrobiales bacterium]|nr:hypothetical protein [Acidimicrobiales bacterium]